MKRPIVCLLLVAFVVGLVVPLHAGSMPTRRCTKCHQVFYNDWWKFCPRCGAEGSEPIEKPSTEGIPVVEGFTIVNNTYRNLPHRYRVERPGDIWTFRHGKALEMENNELDLRIELPKTTVSVDVMVVFTKEDDLQKFLTGRLKTNDRFENVKQLGGRLGKDPMILREYVIKPEGGRDENTRLVVMAVQHEKLVYLLQATCLESDYRKWDDEIRKIFDSFKLLEPAGAD